MYFEFIRSVDANNRIKYFKSPLETKLGCSVEPATPSEIAEIDRMGLFGIHRVIMRDGYCIAYQTVKQHFDDINGDLSRRDVRVYRDDQGKPYIVH